MTRMLKTPPPFLDLNDPDPRYLSYLSKWHWPFTCRCTKKNGWTYDTERGMWVCGECRLPSGFAIEYGASQNAQECVGCGELFVIWSHFKDASFCGDCGGDNAAKPHQHTENPFKAVDRYIDGD